MRRRWKSLVPFLYDWLAHHRLVWPSLSCRWGQILEQGDYKLKQRLYLSEQTDGSSPSFPSRSLGLRKLSSTIFFTLR